MIYKIAFHLGFANLPKPISNYLFSLDKTSFLPNFADLNNKHHLTKKRWQSVTKTLVW